MRKDPRLYRLAAQLAWEHNLAHHRPKICVRPQLLFMRRDAALRCGARMLNARAQLGWAIAGEYAGIPRDQLTIDADTRAKMRQREIRERGVIEGNADVVARDIAQWIPHYGEDGTDERTLLELLARPIVPAVRLEDMLPEAQRQLELLEKGRIAELRELRRADPARETFRGVSV